MNGQSRHSKTRRVSQAISVKSLTTNSISPHEILRGQSFLDHYPWIRTLLPLIVTVCLFAVLFAYSFLGAAIFEALEKDNERMLIKNFTDYKDEFREWIMELAERVRKENYVDDHKRSNYTHEINETVTRFEEELKHKVCEIKLDLNGKPKWTYYGSLFFAGSVITTIGYGHIAPVTTAGRIFCMAYAIFGISLLLLVLASIGSLLARGATLTYRMLHDKIGTLTIGKRKKRPEEEDDGHDGYTRQNGAYAAHEHQRDKVIDDIWGTIRFDKDGKMIMPDDPNAGSNLSSSQSNGDSRKNSRDTSKLRVNFADGKKSPDDLEEGDSHVLTPQGMYLPPQPSMNHYHDPTEPIESEHSIGFGVMDDADEDEVVVPLHVVLLLAAIYIVLLAGTLLLWEDQWDFFDALYFSFVTLTTIGFGDLVPEHQKNLLACTFLIILGMAIISMCIALAQDLIMRKIAWLSQKVGVALLSSSKGDDK